jgi:hypothetical protein
MYGLMLLNCMLTVTLAPVAGSSCSPDAHSPGCSPENSPIFCAKLERFSARFTASVAQNKKSKLQEFQLVI